MKKDPPPRALKTPQPDTRHLLPLALGLFFLVLAAFWAAGQNGFTDLDDPLYVTDNAHVQQGLTWAGLKWAFTNGEATNWHPLTWLSHMLDHQLFGPGPRAQHLTNVCLHAINTALLFLLLHRMTGSKWRSLAVALLFGLHPLRVESVAWISERKDVLSALFFLLTLHAYARYAGQSRSKIKNQKSKLHYGLALAFFALGLMSKPMLVTVPFVLLLLDYWPLRRFDNQKPETLLLEKVPFLLLAGASAVVTMMVQKAGGAVSWRVPLAIRLQTVIVSYARYLGKMFFPAGLAVEYPYPRHWPMAMLLFAAVIVLGISLGVVLTRRRHPYLAVGWFWYVGMLVPVIGLVQVGVQSIADRYTYLPGIGVLIMLVWGASQWAQARRGRRMVLGAAAGAAAIACIAVSQRQIGVWKDSGTLYTHALEVVGKNQDTLVRVADYDRVQGRDEEAIQLYREALEINPRQERPQVTVGAMLYLSGRKEEGIHQLEEALKVLPDSGLLHGNLGIFLISTGRLEEAARHLETGLRLRPDFPEAHVALGDIYVKAGRSDEGIGHYREALKLRPGFAPAMQRLKSLGAA